MELPDFPTSLPQMIEDSSDSVDNKGIASFFLCPPSKKRGYIALHLSVGRSVDHIFVRSITQKVFQVSFWNYMGG